MLSFVRLIQRLAFAIGNGWAVENPAKVAPWSCPTLQHLCSVLHHAERCAAVCVYMCINLCDIIFIQSLLLAMEECRLT
jgi:hypothetical protein